MNLWYNTTGKRFYFFSKIVDARQIERWNIKRSERQNLMGKFYDMDDALNRGRDIRQQCRYRQPRSFVKPACKMTNKIALISPLSFSFTETRCDTATKFLVPSMSY